MMFLTQSSVDLHNRRQNRFPKWDSDQTPLLTLLFTGELRCI